MCIRKWKILLAVALLLPTQVLKLEVHTLYADSLVEAPQGLSDIARGVVFIPQFPDFSTNYQRMLDEKAQAATEAARKAEEARLASLYVAPPKTAYVAPTQSTDNLYNYGYCTWYVKNQKPYLSNQLGNAANWGYILGFDNSPAVGAIAWTARGYAGHVGIVIGVGNGQVQVREMNVMGWDVVSTTWYPTAYYQYIHT